uniref:Uncharacterized protein n=1 Tax=Amphimedon queenslandica TaxID=400682 RepID=A0A1X7UQU2_AMPQE
MSLINFMLDPANALAFGRLILAGIYYDIDALKAVRSHINRHKLYLGSSWSTEYENISITMIGVLMCLGLLMKLA